MCLINRVIDPPFISLVDIDKYQFPLHFPALIILFRSFSHISQGKRFKAISLKVCLICSKLKFSAFAFCLHRKDCLFKFPAIHGDGIFCNL